MLFKLYQRQLLKATVNIYKIVLKIRVLLVLRQKEIDDNY